MYLSEISDQSSRRINMTPLTRLFTENLRRVIAAVQLYGFKVRIVGGAVRDVLIGRPPRDIDLITDALPDEIMFILEKNKIRYLTKGIPHGTVKVRFSEEEEYEITSLAYEIEDQCCPEKLVVHSNQSWEGDAHRRDFTIDALSVDLDGHVYDYTDGLSDLSKHCVNFIGDPETQIKNDPVLILRFFKLLSLFKIPNFDMSVVPILRDNMRRIKRLKPKRVALELSNIRQGPNADRVIKMMQNLGAFEHIGDAESVSEHLQRLQTNAGLRFLLEHAPVHILPAVRMLFPNGQVKIIRGNRGETHGDIFNTIAPHLIDKATQIEGGFFDTHRRRYLSRAQALKQIGVETSLQLRDAQSVVQPPLGLGMQPKRSQHRDQGVL